MCKLAAVRSDMLTLTAAGGQATARHRAAADVSNAKQYSIQNLATGLLDVADNLDRAQDSVVARKEGEAPLSKETETLLEGVVSLSRTLRRVRSGAV